MGTVYKARDRHSNKEYAIKVLRPELAADEPSIQRFEQEVKAVSLLSHPNLVAVHKFDRDQHAAPYMVMDFIDGESLADVLTRQGKISVKRTIGIIYQVCEALSHAHSKGVIHRDLKPNNIILSTDRNGDEEVKLVDFGIAKVIPSVPQQTQNLTQSGEIFGSPLYMSPEQCTGKPLDARSDIYSLGCVMYECLCGHPPFSGENVIQTILKHVLDAPPEWVSSEDPRITADLHDLVMKCLSKEPANRYACAADLMSDLYSVALNKPLTQLMSVRGSARSRSMRPTVLATTLCFAVFFVVASFGTYFFERTKIERELVTSPKTAELKRVLESSQNGNVEHVAKAKDLKDAMKDKVDKYADSVLSKVRSHWMRNDNRVLAWFTIAPSGKLQAVRLYYRSPNRNANLAAENAIRAAAPFAPSPDGKAHSITASFRDDSCIGCLYIVDDIMKIESPTVAASEDYQALGKPRTVSWRYIDADGHPLTESAVPADIKEFVMKHWRTEAGAMALMYVDTSAVGDDEISTKQIDTGWSSAGVESFRRGIVVYGQRPHTERLEVHKIGTESIIQPVPPGLSKGTVAWLGTKVLSKYTGPPATVSGTICDSLGRPITSGEVTIHLSGSWPGRTVDVHNGQFVFNNLSPSAEYLVEFKLNNYDVPTWFVKLWPPGISKDFIATPRKLSTPSD